MAYRIEYRRDGAVIGESHGRSDRASAKQLVKAEIAGRGADIAIVIDEDGSGAEVASFRQDTQVWDDE